ncbi:MAG TPA: sodium-independent anion transporter, partial [Rhizomicrobium sp.]|nr:sodium-independent anion transporter [Rhizomicrobium sp.]
ALVSYQPRYLLLDAEDVSILDISAADELLAFIRKLQKDGLTVAVARVRDSVREQMRLAGVEAAIGPANFYDRITDGVRAYQQGEVRPPSTSSEFGSP